MSAFRLDYERRRERNFSFWQYYISLTEKEVSLPEFFTRHSILPPYLAYPRFLLDYPYPISDTAKLLYILLLDRARISQQNNGWCNEQGQVYVYYTIQNMAREIHKSEMTVKTALKALEEANLIVRQRQGNGQPNRIYIKVPPAQTTQSRQTKSPYPDRQKTSNLTARKLSTNNKQKSNNQSNHLYLDYSYKENESL